MKFRPVWIAFGLGAVCVPAVLLMRRYLPSAGNAWTLVGPVIILPCLPAVFLRAKNEAVPARRSDLIGYAAVLACCAVVLLIARAIIT